MFFTVHDPNAKSRIFGLKKRFSNSDHPRVLINHLVNHSTELDATTAKWKLSFYSSLAVKSFEIILLVLEIQPVQIVEIFYYGNQVKFIWKYFNVWKKLLS